MRLICLFAIALLWSSTALAEPLPDMQGFDLVISDTGSAPPSWEENPTRVYAEVAGEPLYFGGMAGAFYTLRERYGERIHVDRMLVADYLTAGFGEMLDARYAWYFWDDQRRAPGNLPLILALPSKAAARGQTSRHAGSVLDFKQLTARLGRWCAQSEPAACWRGSAGWDDTLWTNAWNHRWEGWIYDHDRGWCNGRLPDYGRSIHPHVGPVYVPPPPRRQHHDEDHWDRQRDREREERQRAERERREQQDRERLERERREQERRDRERREREERERQPVPPVNKAAPPPKSDPPKSDPPPKVQPEKKDDQAQPAPPPPPTKGTNDPKK